MSFTRNLKALPKTFRISLRADTGGYIGRECPQKDCKRYFKVTPGTGLKDIDTCRCPYCGHDGSSQDFFTKAQVDHALSVVNNKVVGALIKDLKSVGFGHRGGRSGVSTRVRGKPPPIRGYSEQALETESICDVCTLRYAIYGVFGFCPDCGTHNNLSILNANFRVVTKMLALSETVDADVATSLVENALEDCVSAFDGWGRAVCKVFALKAADPSKVGKVSFQNIKRAQESLKTLFGFDAEAVLGAKAVTALHRAFQKRHVLAHLMGVIDENYVRQTGDWSAKVGRRVTITAAEVDEMASSIRSWADALNAHLGRLP